MKHGEKIAVVLAGLFFLVALAWSLLSDGWEDGPPGLINGSSDTSFGLDPVSRNPGSSTLDWGQPLAQGGANWIFDIFTPPVIYYDSVTEAFTVTPPFPDADPVEEVFELELVDIQKVPFRFQLVSYAGKRGNYVLTLESMETGRDVFCAPGDTLVQHELRVLSFFENRVVAATSRPGSTEAFDLVGEAVVEDRRSGQRYTLRHNEVTYTGDPVALFVIPSGESITLSKGNTWSGTNGKYTVTVIDSPGKTATVEKTSTDVGDKIVKILQFSNRFNTSDLSNRDSRLSDPLPGTF